MTKESPTTKFQASLRLAGYQRGFSLSGTPDLGLDRRKGLVARFDGGYDYATCQIAAPPGSSWLPPFSCDSEVGGCARAQLKRAAPSCRWRLRDPEVGGPS